MKPKKTHPRGRLIALMVLCAAVFALFLGRLVWLQFFRAEHYAQKAQQAANSSYDYAPAAARGDILDRSGIPLAQDATVYDVYARVPAPPGTELSATLRAAAAAVAPQDPQAKTGSKDVETQLAACLSFSHQVPAGEFLLAQGLSPAAAAALEQTGLPAAGALRLAPRGQRTWAEGSLLPHILGVTGPLTAAQWQAGSGLALDAVIGQSGLEAAFEQTLHGTDGRVTVTVNRQTGALRETAVAAPRAGRDLVLTIDAGLQQAAQAALAAQMEALRTAKPAGKGREVRAGAVVAVEPATGAILAAASLPGYDLAAYRADYAALSADPAAPLFDRACLGLYAPGSAFKPAVAAAALAAGLITPADAVTCTGTYRFYPGYQPGCLQLGHSGPITLVPALAHSCNIYFYDVGRRLGVDAIAQTAQALGLGADTGVEPPQAAGRLTRTTDENYQAGLALMAAIGQGNAAVTPLQLAAYAAALANNGVRPALHFAAEPGTGGRTLGTMPGGAEVFEPIRAGMAAMAGTLRVLREAPVPVAAKTGSPQRAERLPDGSGHYTDSVLIGYAPVDSPRIAVAVVLEYGGGGANAAPILRSLFDYFFQNERA